MSQQSDLIFYTNPMSRGRIVRWMLEEVGAVYRTEVLDYDTTMKAPDYLAINPMGKVPAIHHGDKVVTECAAIIAYLADAFPEAGLAPALDARAAYYRWLFFAAGPLEQATTNRALGMIAPKDKESTVGYGNFSDVMDTLEMAVSANDYIAGDRFTAADVYVGAHVTWGLMFKSIEDRQVFKDYSSRTSDRDAHRRARELDDALMPEKTG